MTAAADIRPPAYVSKARLAHELDCAESTVDELVRRGILPPPVKLTSGCVRWNWDEVVLAIRSLGKGEPGDPYMAGIEKLGDEDDGKTKKRKSSD
jgi:predicted DNA-binding transcriptional regulator AlpA